MAKVKFRRTLFCLAVLHIASIPRLAANDDWNTLKAAEWFALGGIGVAGTTSKEEIAFRSLLKEPNAVAKLKTLLSGANLAGQCYALLGLYVLHDAAYEQNVAHYKSSSARVKTVAGCTIMEQPVSSIVSNIVAGRYDGILSGPVR